MVKNVSYRYFFQLQQLPLEACQNMAPLFHLVVCWSKNARFLPLLAEPDVQGRSLISQIFKILEQKSLNKEMEKQVMCVASSLLNAVDFEEDEEKGSKIIVKNRWVNIAQSFKLLSGPFFRSTKGMFYLLITSFKSESFIC